MANPRRSSLHHLHSSSTPTTILPLFSSSDPQNPSHPLLASLILFLKRPTAFPFLLSVFLLLTWLSLRFQRIPSSPASSRIGGQFVGSDVDANLIRFDASAVARDGRGWLLDPVHAAHDASIVGGAESCASIHVGEIRPGGMRGNHRHHTCNETFIIWGADTRFRLESANVEGDGYAEVGFSSNEVVVAVSPAGTAHALINVDRMRTTFFVGCQDSLIDRNSSTTDYKVWKDL